MTSSSDGDIVPNVTAIINGVHLKQDVDVSRGVPQKRKNKGLKIDEEKKRG